MVITMKCPKCGSKTTVTKIFHKKTRTFRYRKCKNNKCGYKFKSVEMTATDWNYKAIVKKIKTIMDEVE